jgi:hypothetical protein
MAEGLRQVVEVATPQPKCRWYPQPSVAGPQPRSCRPSSTCRRPSTKMSLAVEEFDNKKILPSEREYLVKLYSPKHAKQQKEQEDGKQ